MRLYYDLDKQDSILKDLCDLACHDDKIDICDIKNLPGTPFVSHIFLIDCCLFCQRFKNSITKKKTQVDASKVFAMNWRFFPTLDPQVC